MTIRVVVSATIQPGMSAQFEAAFREVSAKVKGTPGHIRDELLRDGDAPDAYLLIGEWQSREAFLAWENAPIHRNTTTPMRPYWSGSVTRKIYDVAVRLGPENEEGQ
jgi:heme-degrading monooxygenase HmoA